MRALFYRWLYRYIIIAVLTLCIQVWLYGQTGYYVNHFTSKQGLPQNSVRGLAFDQHGFLWLATEGGIARFDGQRFQIINESDHPGIRNQRFTHALHYQDTSIVFIDLLNGIYMLSNDRWSTLQEPDANYPSLVHVFGGLPDPQFINRDSIFIKEAERAQQTTQPSIYIFPVDGSKAVIVSDRVVLLDLLSRESKIITHRRSRKDQFAQLDKAVLKFDSLGQLFLLEVEAGRFEKCVIKKEDGNDWKGTWKETEIFSQHPFEDVFIRDDQKLYKLIKGNKPYHFMIQPVLDLLPENCNINAIAYRKSEDILVLGTDSRGVFVYHRKNLMTYIHERKGFERNNSYYAQCLIDSTSLLVGNGLIIDLKTTNIKGTFPKKINDILLAKDDKGNIYYTQGKHLLTYNPLNGKEDTIEHTTHFATHCITWMDSAIWIGTTAGVGQILVDSIHWHYKTSFKSDQYGIKTIARDHEGNLWFGSYFQLYRLNRLSNRLDSFPEMTNGDIRILTMLRNKMFIGTYGNGYYIFHNGRLVHMPKGRNNELSNTHTFIEDEEGYLWISTNRGLYKTHLDAVEAYLQDTTLRLDYYAYLEEDGIYNTEFNGGCSPPHLKLPDGRYSLPSLEGLVIFNPEHTPHYFPKDSVVIEYIEINSQFFRPENFHTLPANHSNIRVHFASAWWNRPNNQYIYMGMEGPETIYRLCNVDQTSYSLGHLKPGKHTFLMRRRCGFGPDDFVYSRFHFTVAKPWYARGWAIMLFAAALIILTWGTSTLNTRSIRKRNIELKRKVGEQTKDLLESNARLEENVKKLALSEINLRKNISVRDRLISIITHDILTPLRFIGQIARLGTEEKPSDQGLTKRALADVQNAVHKLFHSTQNLLHWVTYHQEQFKTTSVNCSPFALVEQLMEDFSEMSHFQGNTLLNEVPEDDVILTDPRILTIILHNLLSNAIKYTQNGQIRVGSGVEHNWYVLEVSDSGRGMTAEQLEAVRLGTTQHGEISVENITAGNGIGLSLVADLVLALHGRWEIDSPDGAGVRVRIFLSLDQSKVA